MKKKAYFHLKILPTWGFPGFKASCSARASNLSKEPGAPPSFMGIETKDEAKISLYCGNFQTRMSSLSIIKFFKNVIQTYTHNIISQKKKHYNQKIKNHLSQNKQKPFKQNQFIFMNKYIFLLGPQTAKTS